MVAERVEDRVLRLSPGTSEHESVSTQLLDVGTGTGVVPNLRLAGALPFSRRGSRFGPLELQAIPEQGLEGALSPRDSWLDRNEFSESEMCGF